MHITCKIARSSVLTAVVSEGTAGVARAVDGLAAELGVVRLEVCVPGTRHARAVDRGDCCEMYQDRHNK